MSRRGMLLLTSVLLLPLVAGCDGDCSTLEIRAQSSITDPAGLGGIRLRLNGRKFLAEDFATDATRGAGIHVGVPNHGELLVEMELMQDGQLVAEGSFTRQMSRNYDWTIDLYRQVDDPTYLCLGCFAGYGFDVKGEFANNPGEAVWFSWSGLERGSGIVF